MVVVLGVLLLLVAVDVVLAAVCVVVAALFLSGSWLLAPSWSCGCVFVVVYVSNS